MRIHTSLDYVGMWEALKNSGAPIHFENLELHGSRTHKHAFEVALSGSGGRASFGRDFDAATWDEWGAFFGALYDADPEARCGGSVKDPTYRDREHYHFLTGDRFQQNGTGSYLPKDTHPRHNWRWLGQWGDGDEYGFDCTKCSATRPSWKQAEQYAPRAYDTQEA